MGGVGEVLGTNERGAINALVTRTKTAFAETPAVVTLTATSGPSRRAANTDGVRPVWAQA